MLLDGDELGRKLTDFNRSAWRFETQPTYSVSRESGPFAKFLAGETRPEGHNQAWHERVTSLTDSGRSIGRVRTIERPDTNYQRYQLAWGISGNIDAGEDIRILETTGRDLDLPGQDFWLFDESDIVHLNFREDGTLVNVEQIKDPDLDYYLHVRDTALKHAISFRERNARS